MQRRRATEDSADTAKAPTKAGRGDSLARRIAKLDAAIATDRERETRRLIRIAEKAGYFKHKTTPAEIGRALADVVTASSAGPSPLAKKEAERQRLASRIRKVVRKDNGIQLMMVGACVTDLWLRRPELAGKSRVSVEEFIRTRHEPRAAETNIELIRPWLDYLDPDRPEAAQPPDIEQDRKSRGYRPKKRERPDTTRRLILLGSWTMTSPGAQKTRAKTLKALPEFLERIEASAQVRDLLTHTVSPER